MHVKKNQSLKSVMSGHYSPSNATVVSSKSSVLAISFVESDSLFPIICINVSDEDLEALEHFFTHMSPNSGMAFVILPHFAQAHDTIFVDLLKNHTQMPVLQVNEKALIVPNCVYVTPADTEMKLNEGYLCIVNPAMKVGFELPTPSIKEVHDIVSDRSNVEQITDLEMELKSTREYLLNVNDKLETTNRALLLSKDEFQTSNEELHRTNGELRFVNKELIAVTMGLQNKVDELSLVNDDIKNLMGSTNFGTIFLDTQLCLRRYTYTLKDIMDLTPGDIGRSIIHLEHKLHYDRLIEDITDTLRTGVMKEISVSAENRKWYHLRILPYLTCVERVAGVVLTLTDITQIKNAEEALRVSEEKFRAISSSTPDHILVQGLDLRYEFVVNPQLNLTEQEMLGKTDYDILSKDDADSLTRIKKQVLETGKPLHLEIPVQTCNGVTGYFEGSFIPRLDSTGVVSGLIGFFKNITERKRSEEEILRKTARLESYFNLPLAGLAITSPEKGWLEVSPGLCTMLGYSKEELCRKTWSELTYPDDLSADVLQFERVLKGEIDCYSLEKRFIRKNRDIVWTTLSVSSVRKPDHTVEYFIALLADITERKRIEVALRESEAREHARASELAAVLESVPSIVWIAHDPESKVITGNRAASEFLRMPVHANVSKSAPSENCPQHFTVWKDGKEIAPSELPVQLAAKGVLIRDFEEEVVFNDGSRRYLIGNANPLYDNNGMVRGAVAAFQDITERKRAEAELRESESRFRAFMDNNQAIAWAKDEDGRYVYFNRAFEQRFGVRLDEWKDKTDFDLWSADTAVLFRKQDVDVLTSGEPNESIEKIARAGTNECTWMTIRFPFNDESGHKFVAGIGVDISERIRLEDEIHKSQKLESLGLLAGGIAHDFNNLMSGIFGYIDIAITICEDENVIRNLKKAMSTIDRARALTLQLLTFAKGGAPIKSVGNLFPFVHETALFALKGSNVKCVCQVPENLWACSYDQNQIGQVVDNIVINALQAMSRGGTIIITAQNIVLSNKEHRTLPPGNYVKVSFKDTGTGIQEEHISRIFDPFFTTKAVGHGLGLTTSYSIINRHGGYIDVESEVGVGCTFHVYLPAFTARIESEKLMSGKDHSGSGTFIVMDDEQVIIETICGMLESFGYSVICKDNGQDAIDFFKRELAEKRPVAGMIFDLTVQGGMGGRAAVEVIRQFDSHVPVFVASGYAGDPIMKKPAEFGFTASICKPFRKTELAEMLNKFMKKE